MGIDLRPRSEQAHSVTPPWRGSTFDHQEGGVEDALGLPPARACFVLVSASHHTRVTKERHRNCQHLHSATSLQLSLRLLFPAV